MALASGFASNVQQYDGVTRTFTLVDNFMVNMMPVAPMANDMFVIESATRFRGAARVLKLKQQGKFDEADEQVAANAASFAAATTRFLWLGRAMKTRRRNLPPSHATRQPQKRTTWRRNRPTRGLKRCVWNLVADSSRGLHN